MDIDEQINPEQEINPISSTRELRTQNVDLMNNYIAYAMRKSEQQKLLSQLPPIVRKNVCALRKLQVETTNLEAEFHRMVYELDRKYQELHLEIFNKRRDIINGIYKPSEDECDYPYLELNVDPNVEVIDLAESMRNVTLDENSEGVPNFWLSIFKYVPLFESMVKESDELVLKHLDDIRVVSKPLPDLSFVLEFYFSPNEYFTNSVLTKEYFMKCAPDPDDPFSFDGPEIYKSRGCEIDWKDGKDLTVKTIKKKHQLTQERAGNLKTVKTETFFNYFDPPEIPPDENDPHFDEINNILEADFEIGHYLKDRIIPRAILYYTGENDDDLSDDSNDSTSIDDYGVSEEENHADDNLNNNTIDGEGDVAL